MQRDVYDFVSHGLGEALYGAVWGDDDVAAACFPQHVRDRCGDIPARDQEERVSSAEDAEAGRDVRDGI